MTADVELVLFFSFLFIRSEEPRRLKIAYLWKFPFPFAAAAPGCWPDHYHLKEKVHSRGTSATLCSGCVLMLAVIPLGEMQIAFRHKRQCLLAPFCSSTATAATPGLSPLQSRACRMSAYRCMCVRALQTTGARL